MADPDFVRLAARNYQDVALSIASIQKHANQLDRLHNKTPLDKISRKRIAETVQRISTEAAWIEKALNLNRDQA